MKEKGWIQWLVLSNLLHTQFIRKLISSEIIFAQQTDKEVHYIEALVNDGAKIPIDADVGSYEICLPPWYDEEKFKR